jgi:hypothetical protein
VTPSPTSPHAEEIVTGERLQALAETTLLPGTIAVRLQGTKPRSRQTIRFHEHREIGAEKLRLLSASRSLFVYTHALALFQEHVWPRLTGTGYVLITHNSDGEVGPEQLPWVEHAGDKLSRWFTQNLLVDHPKLSPLPIGIANSVWDHGDIEALISEMGERERPEQVYAQFDMATHPDRARAWQAVRAAFPLTAPNPPKRFRKYLAELAQHRFCVCPRGNGIDTHRFWECQYLGVVPVVERSPHVEMWAREGLPMVILDDWGDLSRARLEGAQKAKPPQALPDALCLSHYAQQVKRAGGQAGPI